MKQKNQGAFFRSACAGIFALLAMATHRSEAFQIVSASWNPSGTFQVLHEANTNCSYVLLRGIDVTNVHTVVDAQAGMGALGTLNDTNAVGVTSFYRVQEVTNPFVVSVTPPSATIHATSTLPLTVNLDGPAPLSGSLISLSLNPPATGMIPATVFVPAGSNSATFNYVDGALGSSATVTASYGASSAFSIITITNAFPTNLVINEIDYDQVGTDTAEFVELLNKGTNSIDLRGLALVLINGANNLEYLRVNLSGTLASGQYCVISSSNVISAPGALVLNFPVDSNEIQNGAPDGVALFDLINHQVVDALAYEGPITAAVINGETGTFNLVEGTALNAAVADSNAANGSLIRWPDGTDNNDADSDWRFTSTPTPGAANIP